MRNQRKWFAAVLAGIILLTACFAPAFSGAEGAEPYGDGDGVISRPALAGLYNWLHNTNSDFFSLISFDMISDALGKQGCVKEKDREDYHAAYWTDGDKFVTVTFRSRDGSWGVGSVTTDIPSDEYDAADYSFLPRVGNRAAGSSPTESQTVKAKVQGGSDEVLVTAQVPAEYWVTASSFGEARFLNVPDPSKASGNSAGIRVGFWAGEAALQADREKRENVTELADWTAMGTTLKGCSFTRYGMDMTEYSLPLKEDLWMSLQFYECLPDAGSEAEAIVNSLSIQCGDFTFVSGAQPAAVPAAEPAPAEPAPAAEPVPVAENGGYAGIWVVEELESEGETLRPLDYGIEMTFELQEDGTAISRMDDVVTGTWSAEGNQIAITFEGDTAVTTVENGVMHLTEGDVSMKLVRKTGEGGAAPEPEPEPEPEPVPAPEPEPEPEPVPTEAPAAIPGVPMPDAGEEAYVGTWHLIYVGTGGFTGNAADIGLVGETLVMNEDRTGVLSVDPDRRMQQWQMENGIVMMEGQRLILLREDILQVGTELSGYMIFSKDPAAVWDGSIPLYDPFAQPEPEPEAPAVPAAPAPAPEAPQDIGSIQTEVKYIAKSYIAGGYEMDASVLGGEYAVTLHADGTADFVMVGVETTGLLWKTDGDAVVIDYYGAGELRITADGDGIALDLLGSMVLKMAP